MDSIYWNREEDKRTGRVDEEAQKLYAANQAKLDSEAHVSHEYNSAAESK